MADQISGEEEKEVREKKNELFSLSTVLGPESPEAMRQKKSDLKRYFTSIVVFNIFTKLYLINIS